MLFCFAMRGHGRDCRSLDPVFAKSILIIAGVSQIAKLTYSNRLLLSIACHELFISHFSHLFFVPRWFNMCIPSSSFLL